MSGSMNLMERPLWRGRTNVDRLTISLLELAEKFAKRTFVVTQGSYQNSVAASAGTHDGGGVIDLRWTGSQADIKALRLAGFAAWHRSPNQGPWPHHIHAVAIDHPKLSPSAARQVVAYRAGRNGLANNAPDDGPRISPILTWRTILTKEEDMSLSDEDKKWILKNVGPRANWRYRIPPNNRGNFGGPAEVLMRQSARSLSIALNNQETTREFREILLSKGIAGATADEIINELADRLQD